MAEITQEMKTDGLAAAKELPLPAASQTNPARPELVVPFEKPKYTIEEYFRDILLKSYADQKSLRPRCETWLSYLKQKNITNWKGLEDPQLFQDFVTHLSTPQYSAKQHHDIVRGARTIRRFIDFIRRGISNAVELRLMTVNPTSLIRVNKPKRKKTKALKIGEIRAIIDHPFTAKWKLVWFFEAVFFSGRRLKEVTHLSWENMDFENETYIYFDFKAQEEKEAVMGPLLKQLLQGMKSKKNGFVFPELKDKETWISNKFKDVAAQLELRETSLHKSRASLLAAVGAGKTLGSKMLGNLPGTTEDYYLDEEALELETNEKLRKKWDLLAKVWGQI